MKTTLTTPTLNISLTEISPDFDDPTRLELSFTAELTAEYTATTDCADIHADLFADHDSPTIIWHFNVASRHDNGLYASIHNDHSGDLFDDDFAVSYFGHLVIDFITFICQLLNVPFHI